jgi:hypothetical protein
VHIEFGYRDIKKKQTFGDCLDISTLDDSFWLHPINSKDVIMKISFATEELYQLAHKKLHEAKQIEAKQNDNKQVENSQTQNTQNDNK